MPPDMSKVNTVRKAKKADTITKNQSHKTDTGSPEVQISVLTKDIVSLTEHLKANPKDNSSRRGLLRKVGKRKSLLRYLSSKDVTRYKKVLAKNGIRG